VKKWDLRTDRGPQQIEIN